MLHRIFCLIAATPLLMPGLSAMKYYNKSYYSHCRSGYNRKEPGETAEK